MILRFAGQRRKSRHIAVFKPRAERVADAIERCQHVAREAEGDELAGFVHIVFDDDPKWGALIDNLHVASAHKRRGVGG